MSRAGRRVELAPAYVLHHRPWRDTSRILDVFARDHGRLALFARGVRGPRSKLASVLQPFQPLLLSWSASGDAGQLTRAEPAMDASRDAVPPLPAAALMSGWYLNELLLKLTTRLDPQPALYGHYGDALAAMRAGQAVAPALRRFEMQLLEQLGYGLDLQREARTGRPIEAGSYYHFHASLGFVGISSDPGPEAVAGASVLALAAGCFDDGRALDDTRRVLRAALDHLLEGRELRTRAVARAVARRPRRGGPPGGGTTGNGTAS
jgi:DNA repair protein RecO (recombination protein O)